MPDEQERMSEFLDMIAAAKGRYCSRNYENGDCRTLIDERRHWCGGCLARSLAWQLGAFKSPSPEAVPPPVEQGLPNDYTMTITHSTGQHQEFPSEASDRVYVASASPAALAGRAQIKKEGRRWLTPPQRTGEQ